MLASLNWTIYLFPKDMRIWRFRCSKNADQYLVSHNMAANCQVCYYANIVQQSNFVICLCLKRHGMVYT